MRQLPEMDAFLKEKPEGLFKTIPCCTDFLEGWRFTPVHYLHDSMRLIDMVITDKRAAGPLAEKDPHLKHLSMVVERVFSAAKFMPFQSAANFEKRGTPTFIDLCNDLIETQHFLVEQREELTAKCRAGQKRIGTTLNPVLDHLPHSLQLLLGGHPSFRLMESQDQLTGMAETLGSIRTGMLRIISSPEPPKQEPPKRAKITPFSKP